MHRRVIIERCSSVYLSLSLPLPLTGPGPGQPASQNRATKVNEPHKSRLNVEELQRNRKVPQVYRYTARTRVPAHVRTARTHAHIRMRMQRARST